MAKEKKKFKDTGLFKTIKALAPEALDKITDVAASVYPPLGVVNTLVDSVLDKAKKDKSISTEQISVIKGEAKQYEAEYKDYLADVQDAREMYENTDHSQADAIANKIINYNLWILLGLVIIQVVVIMYVEGQVAAVITGVIGTITGALINERNTVVNFFFGSSKGSKDKDNK